MVETLTYEECVEFCPDLKQAKCVRVYDGDTIYLGTVLPAPYGPTKFACRLLGVDTPELRTRDDKEKALAKEARDIVKAMVLNKTVEARVSGKDKYGRLLVRISTESCPDLSQYLIDEKVAVFYTGGKKRKVDWEALMKEHIRIKSERLVIQDDAAQRS
eukprot:6214845-Pleurochrysis_carterae.AAC.3